MIAWREATVTAVQEETPRARTLVLDVPGWEGHRAGQHVDVRLTADDGYQAQRSYSIASAPEAPELALTVERLDDGEVSPYLAGEVRAGDVLELRGPIGGYFVWSVTDGAPLLLVGGGSGLVPLAAMVRHLAAHPTADALLDVRLLVSARRIEELLYRAELEALAEDGLVDLHVTLTRERPPGWSGFDRRVDAAMLAQVGPEPAATPRIFTCGPTAFVEQVADALVALGHEPAAIHAERFGGIGA